MSEPRRHERMTLMDQVRAVRTEYADEEAEAAELEAAANATEQISPSALMHRW